MASTFTFPDFIGYPTHKVSTMDYSRKPKPGRPYYNMKLEDYPPYKALGEEPVLYGPEPYWPILSGCGLYRLGDSCVCSMECMRKPIYEWAKENPEAFNAKQKEMARWKRLGDEWYKQRHMVMDAWSAKTYWIRQEFKDLQDKESPIGCVDCEESYREYCNCCYESDHGFDDDRDECG
jgi:hypothetical protein